MGWGGGGVRERGGVVVGWNIRFRVVTLSVAAEPTRSPIPPSRPLCQQWWLAPSGQGEAGRGGAGRGVAGRVAGVSTGLGKGKGAVQAARSLARLVPYDTNS